MPDTIHVSNQRERDIMEILTDIAAQGPGGMIALGAIGYGALISLVSLTSRKSKGWR